MTAPRISVVMSVYNDAATLAETLDSILGQTERDFELIVIDDGSTDHSPRILAEYAARDPRVRVMRQKNAGLTRALVAGCAAARAPYIARHDAGDVSDPRRFELQAGALDAAPDLAFVSCATRFAGPDLEPLYVMRGSGRARTPVHVVSDTGLVDAPTSHPSVIFRRDAYERAGGYRAAFYYGQDYDLWYRLAELGKLQVLEEVLYTARVTPQSVSASARARQLELGRLSRAAFEARRRGESDDAIVAEAAKVRPVRRKARPWRKSGGLYFIGEALRRNGDRRARAYLRQAIVAWPLNARAWIRLAQSLVHLRPSDSATL